MAKHDYGVDAPYVPLGLGAAGIVCFGILRPGGRLVIADITCAKAYAAHLTTTTAAVDVDHRSRGPSFWFGGPWQATSLVTATKP